MSKTLADHLIALKADRLRPGMYVAALDRLWLHTPFPPDGFYIRDKQQIATIRRFCTYVYIDPLRSEEPTNVIVPFEQVPATALAPHATTHSVGEEIPWARLALDGLTAAVRQLIRETRSSHSLDLVTLNAGLLPIVDSIQRCPDALLWLIHTEKSTGYIYRRSMGTAITAVAFGQRLGFDRDTLLELAMGGILLDIGKIDVPVTILAKTDNLTPVEYGLVQKHVSHALDMVGVMKDIPERVIDMVSSHHERFDGSGYPQQQRGTEIPLFARIAGIVDTYDAITQERRYAPAISGHTALRYLSGQRSCKFDDALLQEFIHAMGTYPTGTWVELLDGSVGVVCAQDSQWPLTPRVAVTINRNGEPLIPYTVLANRLNPIVSTRHAGQPGLDVPDLEAIA
jgi:HD-GYP domain-containing protein (c-di-GMP phosphodiesterase class II)